MAFTTNTKLKHGAVFNPDISVITISVADGVGDIVRGVNYSLVIIKLNNP